MIFTLNSNSRSKLYRGNSTKKLFPEKQIYERITSPQHKKLFPELINLETLNKNKNSEISRPVVRIDVTFTLF